MRWWTRVALNVLATGFVWLGLVVLGLYEGQPQRPGAVIVAIFAAYLFGMFHDMLTRWDSRNPKQPPVVDDGYGGPDDKPRGKGHEHRALPRQRL